MKKMSIYKQVPSHAIIFIFTPCSVQPSPKVFWSKIRTNQDHQKWLSKSPPNILPGSCYTLFLLFFTSAGGAHLQLWRMLLPERLQPWPMRWTQFLSISSCHLCSSQGPAHQRAGLDDPVKQMDEAFPTPSPLGLLTKSHRAIVTIGGVDESFKALGCPKHYARDVHPTLLCC